MSIFICSRSYYFYFLFFFVACEINVELWKRQVQLNVLLVTKHNAWMTKIFWGAKSAELELNKEKELGWAEQGRAAGKKENPHSETHTHTHKHTQRDIRRNSHCSPSLSHTHTHTYSCSLSYYVTQRTNTFSYYKRDTSFTRNCNTIQRQ